MYSIKVNNINMCIHIIMLKSVYNYGHLFLLDIVFTGILSYVCKIGNRRPGK